MEIYPFSESKNIRFVNILKFQIVFYVLDYIAKQLLIIDDSLVNLISNDSFIRTKKNENVSLIFLMQF